MARYNEPLLNEIEEDLPEEDFDIERKNLAIPNISRHRIMKHFLRLSQMNYGVDTNFYPLGSCTMKYNPKLLERIAKIDKIKHIHPLQDESTVQGCLELMYKLEKLLCRLTGMDAFTLQPAAGAHGEFTGMLITRAYFEDRGEKRQNVIVPDSAHGTNPASAKMAGFNVIEIPSKDGMVDIDALESVVDESVAAFMLTNPNTLGIFEKDIVKISKILKSVGALLYYDGANMNAIMGKTTPAKMGFDIVHLNLHKTFATPHGGGGPGAGPVGVRDFLEPYLPVPRVVKDSDTYKLKYDFPKSIGKIGMFYGNFAVLVKAYAYIRMKGKELEKVAEKAVLNSNYLMEKLRSYGFDVPYYGRRMHEFVISLEKFKEKGLRAMDFAKRLLDYGIHPPTIYFPLIVNEAFMIEPTEDADATTLNEFADAMKKIAMEQPELLKEAPHTMPVKRVNEVIAAKRPKLTWKDLD